MAQKSIEKNSLSSSSVQIKHEWRSREDGHHCFLHWHWKPYSETKDFFDRLSYSSECSPLIRTKVSLTQRKGLSWKRTCLDSYCMNLLTFTHLQSSITELHPEQLSSVDFNCGSSCLKQEIVSVDAQKVRTWSFIVGQKISKMCFDCFGIG